jgi:hypothetical protein
VSKLMGMANAELVSLLSSRAQSQVRGSVAQSGKRMAKESALPLSSRC